MANRILQLKEVVVLVIAVCEVRFFWGHLLRSLLRMLALEDQLMARQVRAAFDVPE